MDHPNAIYFLMAAHAWLVLLGALFLVGSINKGPYKSTDVIANWVKRVTGILCLILGLIALYIDIGKFLGA